MAHLKKYIGLIIHPKQTVINIQPDDREIIWMLVIAMIIKGHQGLIDLPILFRSMPIAPYTTAINNIVGLLFYLGGMTFYLHRIASSSDQRGNPWDLFRNVAYGLVPYIIGNLISTFLFLFGPTVFPSISELGMIISRIIIEELGLLLGIRGIISYHSFQKTHKVTSTRALFAMIVFNVVYFFLTALPFLIKGPYNYYS